jgi:hypothetical protein
MFIGDTWNGGACFLHKELASFLIFFLAQSILIEEAIKFTVIWSRQFGAHASFLRGPLRCYPPGEHKAPALRQGYTSHWHFHWIRNNSSDVRRGVQAVQSQQESWRRYRMLGGRSEHGRITSKQYYLLGYNAVNRCFGGTYRLHLQGRNISRSLLATWFHAGFLVGLFFDPEDGGNMFLRNVGWHSTDYMELYPRRWYSS